MSKFINISGNELPPKTYIPGGTNISGDIAIETGDGIYKKPLKELTFKNDSTELSLKVDAAKENASLTRKRFSLIQSSIIQRLPFRGAVAAYYATNPESNLDFVINRENNFALPLNHISANAVEVEEEKQARGLLLSNAIVLPKGTYRVRAVSTFAVRNPKRHYEQTNQYVGDAYGCNIMTDLYQYDSPSRSMLISDIKHVPVAGLYGKTAITSTIFGFFNICRTSPVGLRVSTDGNISVGDGSLNVSTIPKPPVGDFAHYYGTSWPVQLTCELIDLEDIFNIGDVNYEADEPTRVPVAL